MLVENREFLRTRYRSVFDLMRDYEEQPENLAHVQVIESKTGLPTVQIEVEGRPLFVHSKYDPLKEAERLVANLEKAEQYSHVLFYGLGMGYHIELMLHQFPHLSYSIYEPSAKVFYHFVSHRRIENLAIERLKYLCIKGTADFNLEKFIIDFSRNINDKVLFVSLPSYERIFKSDYEQFKDLFKKHIVNRKASLRVNYAFQRRWVINSLNNFHDVLRTPNILHDVNKEYFKQKPALLVAAGPSLEQEIENIRFIKENKLAYIFAVGSANKALLRHNIFPDAITTYDPQETNQYVFQDIVEEGINHIPLIFGTSVGFETVQQYPGPKFHMLTSQDTIGSFHLRLKNNNKPDYVNDAPSIAVITLQLLYKLGCNPVILVGQNFAYYKNQSYAHSAKKETTVNQKELKSAIRVKSVDGSEVLTTLGFNRMREQMEMYIKSYKNLQVINTTVGGAAIEGTLYMPLKKVIEKVLSQKQVVDHWYDVEPNTYDRKHIYNQYNKINQHHRQFIDRFSRIRNIVNKIRDNVRLNKADNLERLFLKIDKEFNKISRNEFFKVVLMPMLRVEIEILNKNIKSVRHEKNLLYKGAVIAKLFDHFVLRCLQTYDDIQTHYESFKKKIEEHHYADQKQKV